MFNVPRLTNLAASLTTQLTGKTYFNFPAEAADRFNDILQKSRLGNDAALIDAATTLYTELKLVADAGCRIFVKDQQNKYHPILSFESF